MQPEIKLVISCGDKVIQTVNKELNEKFVKSIEDFQVIANATMTKLIDDSGDSGGVMEEADDSDNEDEDEVVAPKKKKK